MDISLVVMILFGLVIIFSFVVAYFSARTAHIAHVLGVAGLFLVGVASLILGSATLQTHATWRGEYNELHKQLQAELEKTEAMLHGDPRQVDSRPQSIPELRGVLERTTLDRGRVWRNVRPEAIQQNQITVNMRGFGDAGCVQLGQSAEDFEEPTEGPAEGQTPASRHAITAEMILYAFQETSLAQLGEEPQGEAKLGALFADSDLPLKDTQGACRLPAYFMGEYRVTGVTDDTVTLLPTLPLDQGQIDRIQAAQGTTWVLYEVMPIDRHDVFAELSAEQMQALVPQERTGLGDDAYARLIEQYVRNDEPARPDDPEEQIWMRVKFLKSHTMEVDKTVEGETPVATDRYFDSGGLAVAPLLHQGGPTEFAPGDTALLDLQTAQRLIEQQICESEGERIYRRPLRDFHYVFHKMAIRLEELEEDMALVRRQTAGMNSAKEQADQQIANLEQEISKLREDLANFQREAKGVAAFLAQLQKYRDEKQSKMSRLYRENIRRAEQLSRIHQQLNQLPDRSQRASL